MTASVTENIFENFVLDISVPAQSELTSARRQAVAKYAKNDPIATQFSCAVAEATNKALGVHYTGEGKIGEITPMTFGELGTFQVVKRGRARFGLDSSGNFYLSVTLVDINDPDGKRYRLTWKNRDIPKALARVAVAHDAGEAHSAVKAKLRMKKAKLVISDPNAGTDDGAADAATNEITPTPEGQAAPATKPKKRYPNGHPNAGKPRTHKRACYDDLVRVYA